MLCRRRSYRKPDEKRGKGNISQDRMRDGGISFYRRRAVPYFKQAMEEISYITAYLPSRLKKATENMPAETRKITDEIRLRKNGVFSVFAGGKNLFPDSPNQRSIPSRRSHLFKKGGGIRPLLDSAAGYVTVG